jgi:hypothetical protein
MFCFSSIFSPVYLFSQLFVSFTHLLEFFIYLCPFILDCLCIPIFLGLSSFFSPIHSFIHSFIYAFFVLSHIFLVFIYVPFFHLFIYPFSFTAFIISFFLQSPFFIQIIYFHSLFFFIHPLVPPQLLSFIRFFSSSINWFTHLFIHSFSLHPSLC